MSSKKELFGEGKGSDVNVREVLYNYIKNWKWFLVSSIFFLVLGYIYILAQVPLYKVTTAILIKDEKSGSAENDILKQLNLNSSSKIIDNEIQILKSNTLMEKVVKRLNLQTSYYVQNRISHIVLYQDFGFNVELIVGNNKSFLRPWTLEIVKGRPKFDGKMVEFNTPVKTPAGLILIKQTDKRFLSSIINVKFSDIAAVAENYSNALKILPVSKESTVLSITLEDESLKRGEDILNVLVEEYNQAAIDNKNITTSNQLSFIKDRIASIAKELSSVERSVQNYKSSNSITDISTESSSFLELVQTNDAEINKISIQQNTLRNLESYLREHNQSQTRLPAMLGISDPTILSLVNQLGEVQIKKQSLLRTIPETNPIVSSLNDQISALKSTIFQTLQNLKNGLAVTGRQLASQASQYQALIKNVPSRERGLVDVMREQSIKNNLFIYLLQKREETALSLASTIADSRTIYSAKGSSTPIKPVKSTLYLTFLLFGIFLPFSVIAVKQTFNVKIRGRADIEKITDATILADIQQSSENSSLIVIDRPRSMIAEQIRSLRSNLKYIDPDNNRKVILFTSSISGEGKSFISLNLGASLASTKKRVIILELDLRKPKLNASLGIDNENGISNYLIGQAQIEDIIKPIAQQEGYFIITSGPKPPNPAELLLNGRLDELIMKLKQDFDYVLMDAPPVGLVTDAQILSNYSDICLYMVRYNYTMKGQLKNIDEIHKRKLFNNFNLIFNSVDTAAINYGYGYGYGYGYAYYGEEEKQINFWDRIFKKNKI